MAGPASCTDTGASTELDGAPVLAERSLAASESALSAEQSSAGCPVHQMGSPYMLCICYQV